MVNFVLRRLLGLPLLLLAITLLVAGVMQLLSPEQRAASFVRSPNQLRDVPGIIRTYGLDQPFATQYTRWLGELARGNLGFSRVSGKPVVQTIRERFPATLELALLAAVFIVGVSVWLGTLSALRQNTWVDHLTRLGAVLGYSLPTFVLGLWLLMLFYGGLGWLPGSGNLSNDSALLLLTGEVPRRTGLMTLDALLAGRLDVFWDALRHLVLPVLTLVIISSAQLLKVMRTSMLEALQQDYVRTARAKGLSNRQVNLKHARRNALVSVTTVAGFVVTGLLSGSVLTEAIFAYPGIGGWGAKAAQQLDYAGVLGFALFTAALVVIGNLVVDVLYSLIDPRLRFD